MTSFLSFILLDTVNLYVTLCIYSVPLTAFFVLFMVSLQCFYKCYCCFYKEIQQESQIQSFLGEIHFSSSKCVYIKHPRFIVLSFLLYLHVCQHFQNFSIAVKMKSLNLSYNVTFLYIYVNHCCHACFLSVSSM